MSDRGTVHYVQSIGLPPEQPTDDAPEELLRAAAAVVEPGTP
jgi:hypothetical protein